MSRGNKKNQHVGLQLLAGGAAGFVESSICHPLDTIKTRMQLRKQPSAAASLTNTTVAMKRSSVVDPTTMALRARALSSLSSLAEPTAGSSGGLHEPSSTTLSGSSRATRAVHLPQGSTVMAPMGPFGTARRIVQREGVLALYKGLTAVWMGIVPKMAIRFVSFEQYRDFLGRVAPSSVNATAITFSAGLMSGLTEAILVVTPAEVCKIRMQSQYNSMVEAAARHRKYTNVFQTALTIVREEGFGALYQGLIPTMMRQGCNQAANFTGYNFFKNKLLQSTQQTDLYPYQSLVLGGLSGGIGPLINNPLDVVKTRMQKQVIHPGKTPKYTGLGQACSLIAKEEGTAALWKGITPRLLRIMPGQAITFMTYEFVSSKLQQYGLFKKTV